MIKLFSPIFLIASLSCCATWDAEEKTLEYVYITAHVVDYLQSRDIVNNQNDLIETNIALGSHPTNEKINIYFVTTLVAHPFITHLFKSHKKKWLYFSLGIELFAVGNNHGIGLKAELP